MKQANVSFGKDLMCSLSYLAAMQQFAAQYRRQVPTSQLRFEMGIRYRDATRCESDIDSPN